MNELLQALTDAAKVGFDAPRCRPCIERPVTRFTFSGEPLPNLVYCPVCHATGLDASDPERLIGRAMVWLLARGLEAKVTWHTLDVFTLADPDDYHECHDNTPTGLAAVLLRIVARVGAPHPQTAPETRETETA
jgi:hypothetical protein